MAFFLRLALWASLAFWSASELVIDVQPSVISPEITAQLMINCFITNNQVQQLDLIKSLTLSRYNETTREFEDLFSLNASTLDLKQLLQLKYSQVSFGNLFITLTLQNPTEFDAKVYRCNATGDNEDGMNNSLFAKKTVEYETNSTVLIKEIQRLKKNENFQCSLKKDEHSGVNQKSRLQFYGSSEIIQELIEPLTIKCLFKTLSHAQSETSTLQSLCILHETNGVIAYINKQQPVIATIQGGNLKNVEGAIYDKELKDSYLQVTWNDLKHSESGKYFCEAHVNHSDGRFDKMNEMLTIIVQSPTLDDLVKAIQKLQRQADIDKESVRENQHKIKTIQEDLDIKQQGILGLKEDVNTTKQDVTKIKENLDTKHQNILSIRENIDTNKHNMSIFQENLTFMVANFSAALIEVQKYINKVNRLLQYYHVPPMSCRNVTSSKARVILTLASKLEVMCDTKTDGGGWIIFQRRIIGEVDFYRGWEEYRDGFGDYSIGEFFLGNENIFKLTSTGQYDLRIDLEYNNKTYFAQYENFKVLNETEKYKLQIGNYSGNAGDGLSRHNDMFFTTFDRDNDLYIGNCAKYFSSAWWYSGCGAYSLNGKWGSKSRGHGLHWAGLTGSDNSVSFSEMKLRERK